MRYLVKIVDLANMTAAGQALGVAQPALGAQIRQLESELGMQLLQRHSRGVAPTEAGKLLAKRGRLILEEVDQLHRDLKTLTDAAPDHLSFGVSPTMVLMLGDVLLAMAKEDMPDVQFSLIEERTPGLTDALQKGQAEVGFLFDVEEHAGLDRRAVLEEDLLLVTAPAAGVQNSNNQDKLISLEEALRHDLVMAGAARGVLRKIVAAEAARMSVDFKVAFDVHSITAMKAMVLAGKAATIIPYSLAAHEIDSGALIARKIDRPGLTRILYLVQRSARLPLAYEDQLTRFLNRTLETYLSRTAPWTRGFGPARSPSLAKISLG
ncbi:LysR substrate-binding domain-containing protein [Roseiarcaceae bacterium H3SJ34-1]|nr:LysR substrate-binding domain-containing protein [Roseiarcaceae bacterium H3SJ34-1]